jgi:hypothetical protein
MLPAGTAEDQRIAQSVVTPNTRSVFGDYISIYDI